MLGGLMAVRYVDWTDPIMLNANHQQLLTKLKSKLQVFEMRYELKSSQLQDAIEAGKIKETAEVASWVVTYRAFRKITDARPS
jgi:hypothetical protein